MNLRRPLCAFCLFFVLILALFMYCFGKKAGRNETVPGTRVNVTGRIRSMQEKDGRLILRLKNTSVSDKDILLYLSENDPMTEKLHIGSYITAAGNASDFKKAHNRGQFDAGSYYALRNVAFPVYDVSINGVDSRYYPVRDMLYRLKESTDSVYESCFDPREYGMVKALVLADRSDLDPEIRDEYRDAGISHILALSGLHIATMGFILFGALRKSGLGNVPCFLLVSSVMIMYCLMVGMPVSAVRALIMFVIAMGSYLVHRTPDLNTSAALACLIMLIINPDSLYDPSFLLSFSAVMGIGLVYPALVFFTESLRGRGFRHGPGMSGCERVLRRLRTALMVSLSIQLAMLPFSLWFFYQVPVYSILLNLVVVPLAAILLPAAIITGILGDIFILSGNLPGLKTVMLIPVYTAKVIIHMYDVLIRLQEKLPGALIVPGRPSGVQMCICIAVLAAVTAAGNMLKRKYKSAGKCTDAEKKRLRKTTAILSFICLAGTGCLFVRTDPGFEVSALYVGQGQCFIVHGKDVPTVMFDCGSTDEKQAAEYTVIPFLKYCGLGMIDTVFISHLDNDHVNALIDMLDEKNRCIRIKRIVIPGSLSQEGSDNHKLLTDAAKKAGVKIYTMREGCRIKWKRMTVTCLYPGDEDEGALTDINEGSLVLSLKYNVCGDKMFGALFTGDISSEAEDELIRRGAGEHDMLQVAHHGSRFSANESFLETVSPRIAVISAGKDNPYGHPHEGTLKLLDLMHSTDTFITFRDGETDVDVKEEDGRLLFGIRCHDR
ncbi:MAG: DNA internalization-related competence protein ComEC/Rec2 [Lachnospiraceae bacterium]|nr:DNA internalization-related competence protein ComEC/Rec2 [Lachnospiraceae bacterium]